MISKAKMFDGYANAYDQWFMKNENVFASELKLLRRTLNRWKRKRYFRLIVVVGFLNLP